MFKPPKSTPACRRLAPPSEVLNRSGALACGTGAEFPVDALETVKQVLRADTEPVLRLESLGMRGELRLKRGHLARPQAGFCNAITVAASIGAKAWESRATMSFTRLLDKQGRRGEAPAVLADLYNSLIEGFDTVALNDAKAVLDELAK